MPEAGNHYIGTDLVLPRGDHMARDHVVAESEDATGNVMGSAHTTQS